MRQILEKIIKKGFDEEVYKLYGLAGEEIEIIENSKFKS